jgi:hypothetical protein
MGVVVDKTILQARQVGTMVNRSRRALHDCEKPDFTEFGWQVEGPNFRKSTRQAKAGK